MKPWIASPDKKVWHRRSFMNKTCMSGSSMTVQRAIKNKVVFIFNMLWWRWTPVKVDTVFPTPCINTQTMATTPKPAQQPPVRVALDGRKIVSIFVLRLQSPIQQDCYECYLGKVWMQPNALPFICCPMCYIVGSADQTALTLTVRWPAHHAVSKVPSSQQCSKKST